jgi:LPXTG-site transpeptidase (sortase) family protein
MQLNILKFLKVLNIVISLVIAVFAVYILIYPYLPETISTPYFADQSNTDNSLAGETFTTWKTGEKITELKSIPADNRLFIPKIGVDAPIGEASDKNALGVGMMHIPNTSTPDAGGNTVVIGHRVLFTTGPDTLYFLNEVAVNDMVYVYWKGTEYVYKVYEIKIVNPDQVDIEKNTKEAIITLYTCTPRWTSQKRLVVRASLQQ